MRRTGPARTIRLAAAAAASLALLLPTAAAAETTTPSPSGSGNKVVFTVGILNDIDSLNPFTGILAESYEVYQLMYGYLVDNAAADFTPDPRPGRPGHQSPTTRPGPTRSARG